MGRRWELQNLLNVHGSGALRLGALLRRPEVQFRTALIAILFLLSSWTQVSADEGSTTPALPTDPARFAQAEQVLQISAQVELQLLEARWEEWRTATPAQRQEVRRRLALYTRETLRRVKSLGRFVEGLMIEAPEVVAIDGIQRITRMLLVYPTLISMGYYQVVAVMLAVPADVEVVDYAYVRVKRMIQERRLARRTGLSVAERAQAGVAPLLTARAREILGASAQEIDALRVRLDGQAYVFAVGAEERLAQVFQDAELMRLIHRETPDRRLRLHMMMAELDRRVAEQPELAHRLRQQFGLVPQAELSSEAWALLARGARVAEAEERLRLAISRAGFFRRLGVVFRSAEAIEVRAAREAWLNGLGEVGLKCMHLFGPAGGG